jgi:hypothetical protein
MFDTATIGAALTSAKVILELAKNANDAQLAMKISSEIANLQARLIDVQQQALALQAENQDLRDDIRKMKRIIEEEESFEYLHGMYWKTRSGPPKQDFDEHGNEIVVSEILWDGPFCPICKDVNKKSVRFRDFGIVMPGGTEHVWVCPVHPDDRFQGPTM